MDLILPPMAPTPPHPPSPLSLNRRRTALAVRAAREDAKYVTRTLAARQPGDDASDDARVTEAIARLSPLCSFVTRLVQSPDWHVVKARLGRPLQWKRSSILSALLSAYARQVPALCQVGWSDSSAPKSGSGLCQVCGTSVNHRRAGLHCAHGTHSICWGCMAAG